MPSGRTGWLGSSQINQGFLYGGLVGLIVLVIVQLFLAPSWAELERTP